MGLVAFIKIEGKYLSIFFKATTFIFASYTRNDTVRCPLLSRRCALRRNWTEDNVSLDFLTFSMEHIPVVCGSFLEHHEQTERTIHNSKFYFTKLYQYLFPLSDLRFKINF